jgi:hypothetical protein
LPGELLAAVVDLLDDPVATVAAATEQVRAQCVSGIPLQESPIGGCLGVARTRAVAHAARQSH